MDEDPNIIPRPAQSAGTSIRIHKSKATFLVGLVLLLIMILAITGFYYFSAKGTLPSLNVKKVTDSANSIVNTWDPTQSGKKYQFTAELPIDTKSDSVSTAIVIYTISGRINDIQPVPGNNDMHIVQLISGKGVIQDFDFQVNASNTPISLTKKATNETTNIPFNNLSIGDPVDLNFTIDLKKNTSTGLVTHIIKYE